MTAASVVQLFIEGQGVIFCLLALALMLIDRKDRNRSELILTAMIAQSVFLLIGDMISIYFRGRPGETARLLVWIGNLMVFLQQLVMLYHFGLLAGNYIYREPFRVIRKKRWMRSQMFFLAVAFVGVILTPISGFLFTIDEMNCYYRGDFFLVFAISGIIAMLIPIFLIIRERKRINRKNRHEILIYLLIPLLAIIIQVLWYGLSLINSAVALAVLVFVVRQYSTLRRKRIDTEKTLLQSRAYLLNSQIQPHFVFNCLSVIQSLIEEDPEAASDAMEHFSSLLRRSMDLNTNEDLVFLMDEIDYTKNYLYMEQLRFGRKLGVVYDIEERTDVKVPFLSVQPIVENAVRYGVRQRIKGGTVTIKGATEGSSYVIRVIDDGVGFHVNSVMGEAVTFPGQDLETHGNGVGLKNVSERLALMCKGTLEVESEIDVGTTVTIRIPIKEEVENE